MLPKIRTDYPLIDDVLEPHRAQVGGMFDGYRAHAFRMLNFVFALIPPELREQRQDQVAVMAAFHDLPVMQDGSLVYLERAADLAVDHLARMGRADWAGEARLMIENHHKIRRYRGPHAVLVEATRRADWIDVSLSRLRFGLPRSYVREVASAFPLTGFYPWPVVKTIGGYAVRHPRAPLPMLRW